MAMKLNCKFLSYRTFLYCPFDLSEEKQVFATDFEPQMTHFACMDLKAFLSVVADACGLYRGG